MHIQYDEQADAAYIYLDDAPAAPGSAVKTYACDKRAGTINLDFGADGRLLGIEVLDARRLLPITAMFEARRL
jgi:uncharacterized protein YuzE